MLRSVNKIRIGFGKRENAMFLFGNTFGCASLAARNGKKGRRNPAHTANTKPNGHVRWIAHLA